MQQQTIGQSAQDQRSKQPYNTRTSMQKALEILTYENRVNYSSNYHHRNNTNTNNNKHGGSKNGGQKPMMDKKSKIRKVSFSVQ